MKKYNNNKRTNVEDAFWMAMNNENWNVIREFIRGGDAKRIVQYALLRRWNVISAACAMNAPVDVVESVRELHPAFVDAKNRNRTTPLHIACGNATEEVVEYLLRTAPRSVAETTKFGTLPLHEAVRHRRSASLVRRVLLAHPTAVYHKWNEYVNIWRRDLDNVYPDLRRLPRHDVRRIDEPIDGATRVLRTFSVLFEAYVRGFVAVEENDDENVVPPQIRWSLLRETLRHSRDASVPTIVVRVVVDDASGTEFAYSDFEGNFPLHLACALPPLKE